MENINQELISKLNELLIKLDHIEKKFENNRKTVPIIVRGAGRTARIFLSKNESLSIKYIVDNELKNKGKKINGYLIKHPSEIKSDLYKYPVVVAADKFYQEISEELEKKGLKEGIDFIKSKWLDNRVYDFEEAIEENLKHVKEHMGQYVSKSILITITQTSEKNFNEKSFEKFWVKWNKARENENLIIGSTSSSATAYIYDRKYPFDILRFPFFLESTDYPENRRYALDDKGFVSMEKFILSDEIKEFMRRNPILKIYSKQFRLEHPDLAENYEYIKIFYIVKYVKKLFSFIRPIRIYLWNEFRAEHSLINMVAKQMQIEVQYVEFGSLPGTLAIDTIGQMGKSWPAVNAKDFLKLSVEKSDLDDAKKIWHYLYLSKENRRDQCNTNSLWASLKNKFKLGSPTILFVGQYDYQSGIQPYTEESRKFHSPVFSSSLGAAIYLSEICKRRGWNLIYKFHPMIKYSLLENETKRMRDASEDTILMTDGDINDIIDVADVVVTILSSTAYIALIRKKPVVMLGYMHLKDKGCTYQAFQKEEIENTIYRASIDGFTKEQQENFILHIAQMKKYYLYDNLNEKPIICGQKID